MKKTSEKLKKGQQILEYTEGKKDFWENSDFKQRMVKQFRS